MLDLMSYKHCIRYIWILSNIEAIPVRNTITIVNADYIQCVLVVVQAWLVSVSKKGQFKKKPEKSRNGMSHKIPSLFQQWNAITVNSCEFL